jgi:hypothetical protein
MQEKSWRHAILLALAAAAVTNTVAQTPATDSPQQLSAVEIKLKKNPGDAPYKALFSQQKDLMSYHPPGPLVIDMRFRLSFTELDAAQRDVYLPDTWAVAVVGDTVDHPVEVTRGGYFLLPDLKQAARERATVMFNTPTRKNWIDVGWLVRLKENNTLPYADFAKALEEIRHTQAKMPWYRIAFHYEKKTRFNALKACFISGDGDIVVDGQPAETTSRGPCKLLKFEPAKADSPGSIIAMAGSLANVTLDSIN